MLALPRGLFYPLLVVALVLKTLFILFGSMRVPSSMLMIDSQVYLESGKVLVTEHEFATKEVDGKNTPVHYRTPGYPLFLGLFHHWFKIPLAGIIFIQSVLTLLTAIMVYKAANLIDIRLGLFSGLIILFDPAITIYSAVILTEPLFLFFLGAFLASGVLYITRGQWRYIILAALLLGAATYVRPISYYLGIVVAIFLLLKKLSWRTFAQCLMFVIIIYGLLGLWHMRNYKLFHQNFFCSITNATVARSTGTGLLSSYERNEDSRTKGLPPVAYYMNVSARSLLSLMTRPASLKNFNSDLLKKTGKVFAYPWMIFWLMGFIVGVAQMGHNVSLQLSLLCAAYFLVATIIGTALGAGPRFLVPIMPFIALLSANGWVYLNGLLKRKNRL